MDIGDAVGVGDGGGVGVDGGGRVKEFGIIETVPTFQLLTNISPFTESYVKSDGFCMDMVETTESLESDMTVTVLVEEPPVPTNISPLPESYPK